MRITRATAAVLVAGVLALSGCGDGEDASGDTDEEVTSPEAWQELDACALLADDEVADLMGKGHPEPEASHAHGRPTCEWTDADAFGQLRVMLWDPPVDGVANDPKAKTIKVGDDVGRIHTQSAVSCSMDIETDTAYVQLDLTMPSERLGDDKSCAVAAATGESVISELGW